MALTEKEKGDLLPPICPEGKHKWMRLSAHGCGALADDHILSEAIVLGTKVEEGGPGTVCGKCFQIWGEPPGIRDKNLEEVYLELKSWELKV